MKEGRRGGGRVAEPNHNWPDSGRWFGAVAGWNMCVSGGRVKRRGHCRDGVHKISRLVLYHRNCSALN